VGEARPKKCIGHSVREGNCTNAIGLADLELNGSGLWCVECEKARRRYITAQFAEISKSLEPSSTTGEGE
jgi:hypothetical protein